MPANQVEKDATELEQFHSKLQSEMSSYNNALTRLYAVKNKLYNPPSETANKKEELTDVGMVSQLNRTLNQFSEGNRFLESIVTSLEGLV